VTQQTAERPRPAQPERRAPLFTIWAAPRVAVLAVGLLVALALSPLAAQPPAPPGGGPGRAGQPGPRGQHGPPPKPGGQSEKDKASQKFGPISVLPLQHLYFMSMGAPPVVDPAFDDALFFAAIKTKAIGAWKIADGQPVWAVPDITAVQPLVADSGRLYAVLDGEVATFDAASGKPGWRLPSGPVTAAPVAKAGWLILAVDAGEVHALRGETGEKVWQAKLGAPIKARPVIVGDRLYVAPQNNQLVAFDLVSGRQLWSQDFEEAVTALAAQDQRVFAGTSRMFYGLDHAGHVKWKRRIGAEVIGQPVTDATGVYAAFTDNTLMAFGTNKGDLLWRAPLTYRPISGPTRADDTLLLTGIAPIVHGYDVKDGKQAPDFALPADPRVIFVTAPHFSHGPTFFQDIVLVFFAHGWAEGARRIGPGVYTPFTDPGTACPALTFPGEAPPPTAAAPPKA
jgi:outer membrane protein assembly factor BamB